MRTMRIIGLLMFLYGAISLALLYSPWKHLALDYSLAHVVSRTDRRVGNTVEGPVDEPLALAGSAVMMFSGLWFGLLVPRVFARNRAAMEDLIRESQEERSAAQDSSP